MTIFIWGKKSTEGNEEWLKFLNEHRLKTNANIYAFALSFDKKESNEMFPSGDYFEQTRSTVYGRHGYDSFRTTAFRESLIHEIAFDVDSCDQPATYMTNKSRRKTKYTKPKKNVKPSSLILSLMGKA